MTMQPSPDLLDLAEAVAAGTLRADDAERQLRLALGPDRAAESEQAVRELRGLIGAAGAVRAHARATREAFDSASPDLAATVAPTPASIATLVPGRVTAGAIHHRSSNGGDGAGRAPRRTWLLAAAALLLVGGAMAAGSGLVKLPSLVPPARVRRARRPTRPPAQRVRESIGHPQSDAGPGKGTLVDRGRRPMTAARLGGTATLLPDGRGHRGRWDPRHHRVQGVARAIRRLSTAHGSLDRHRGARATPRPHGHAAARRQSAPWPGFGRSWGPGGTGWARSQPTATTRALVLDGHRDMGRRLPGCHGHGCPTATCWSRVAGSAPAGGRTFPPPSSTNSNTGCGPPPGAHGAVATRPRCCPKARCWPRAASALRRSCTTLGPGPGPPPRA